MIEEVSKGALLPLIRLAFVSDEDLVKYHIEPGTFEEMCESNYKRICTYEDSPGELKYYKITINNSIIGYQVIYKDEEKTLLVSFGINVLFRRSFLLEDWRLKIKENFGSVMVLLYEKNYRAIRFFIRNGFRVGGTFEKAVALWQ